MSNSLNNDVLANVTGPPGSPRADDAASNAEDPPDEVVPAAEMQVFYAQASDDASQKLVFRANSVQYWPNPTNVVFRGEKVAVVTDPNDINDLREHKKTKHDALNNQIKLGKKAIPVTLHKFHAENFVILETDEEIEFCVRMVLDSDPGRYDDVYGLIRLVVEDHRSFFTNLLKPQLKDYSDAFFSNTSPERKKTFMTKVMKIMNADFKKDTCGLSEASYKNNESVFSKRFSAEDAKSNRFQPFDSAVAPRAKKESGKKVKDHSDLDANKEPDPNSLHDADDFFDIVQMPDGGYTIEVDARSLDQSTLKVFEKNNKVEIHTSLRSDMTKDEYMQATSNKPKQTYETKQKLQHMTMQKWTAAGNLILVVLGDNPEAALKKDALGRYLLNVMIPPKSTLSNMPNQAFVPSDMDTTPVGTAESVLVRK